MRQIILVPDDDNDRDPAMRKFWENFCRRLSDAVIREGLEAEIVIVDPNHIGKATR